MITLQLLGTPDVRTVTGDRAHGVLAQAKHLAYLAIAASARRSPVRRDRVVGLLWPELDDDRARNALSKAIHNCRRTFGEDSLVGRFAEQIGLDVNQWSVDVWDFEDAVDRGAHSDALALFRRGEFMEGFHVPDASSLEHWIDGERDRLRQRAIEAASALADNAENDGDLASASEHVRLLGELCPFDERILRRRLTLLDRNADRASAVSAFADFADRLQRELDVSPSAETVALLERIRRRSMVPSGQGKESVDLSVLAPVQSMVPIHPNELNASVVKLANDEESHSVAATWATDASLPTRATRSRPLKIGVALVGFGVVAAAIAWMSRVPSHDASLRSTFVLMPVGATKSDSTTMALKRDIETGLTAQMVAMGRVTLLQPTDSLRARESGAGHFVDATVEVSNNRATVRASIRRASDGNIEVGLDAISVPHAKINTLVPLVVDRVSGAVAALSDTLYRAWSLAGSRPPSYSAYQAFSLALESIAHYIPSRSVAPIVEQLVHVSKLDSSFAAARLLLLEQSDLAPSMHALSDSVQSVALAGRHTLGAYDAAALDNMVAIRAGEWEAALEAANRMVSIAPTLPDAHFAVARAQMATLRYRSALASLDTISRQRPWFAARPELWQWDLFAHHALGEYETGVVHFARLTAETPDKFDLCFWGIPDLVALGREAAVDSLSARCTSMVGMAGAGGAKIPNRFYFDFIIPQYLAHGNRAAAIRAAIRVRPGFVKYAGSEPPKARDLATIDCMLGEWAACYPPLAKWTRKSKELYLYGLRRLGVAAAHMGDSAGALAVVLALDSAATSMHRGYALVSRAMIYAAAGRRDSAIYFLGRAINAGVSPSGLEWVAWPGAPETQSAWTNDWYHAYELLPLRSDSVFAAMLRPRND